MRIWTSNKSIMGGSEEVTMNTMRRAGVVYALSVVLAGCSANAGDADNGVGQTREALSPCVTPVSNLVVTQSTTLCPGTYNIGDPEGDGVIQIKGNQVVLTISGVTLTGTGKGFGITASGVNGATIQSSTTNPGTVQNFQAAILINGGASHSVTNNVLSHNAKRPLTNSINDFLSIWQEFNDKLADGQIGDGVVLLNVASATITNNQMQFQQNGISLFESNNVTIQSNVCSNNQGWGISLLESNNNTIANNQADNVNLDASPFCASVYNGACDTAGILVIKASNNNTIQGNSAQNGGDGIFSAAIMGTTHFGADGNRYLNNDVSQAKAHGLEATFCNNLDVENNTALNDSLAGIWLGGSTNSIIRGNTVKGAGFSGITNQGAQNITIENNVLSGNAQSGIGLTDLTGDLARPSAGYFIARNTIENNGQYGISAENNLSMNATGNVISGNGLGSVQLSFQNETSPLGPIHINNNDLLDASKVCGGVDVAGASCSCSAFNGNASACNGASGCTYFSCSNRCLPAGSTSCDAGCGGCTGCRAFDGNLPGCNAAGCAFYSCSNECQPPGTSECVAGCTDQCPSVDCNITSVTDITTNWWGTTNLSTIEAAICGAALNPVPFATSPF
jgi:parallel beta-helix repeat protein